jgi:hypothetical protein
MRRASYLPEDVQHDHYAESDESYHQGGAVCQTAASKGSCLLAHLESVGERAGHELRVVEAASGTEVDGGVVESIALWAP